MRRPTPAPTGEAATPPIDPKLPLSTAKATKSRWPAPGCRSLTDVPTPADTVRATGIGAIRKRLLRCCRVAMRQPTSGESRPPTLSPWTRGRRRSAPARGGRSRPAGPPTAEANVPALAGQFPQYAADGVLGARADLTAARNQERFFASQVTAGGPIWPHGTPRPCRPSSSQIPENCVNAANSWIPASGRSRTRTWDLFLIRKTFCPLQSSQLALNPCKPRATAPAEGDWRGLAGTSWWPHRGPTTAVRGQGVV